MTLRRVGIAALVLLGLALVLNTDQTVAFLVHLVDRITGTLIYVLVQILSCEPLVTLLIVGGLVWFLLKRFRRTSS